MAGNPNYREEWIPANSPEEEEKVMANLVAQGWNLERRFIDAQTGRVVLGFRSDPYSRAIASQKLPF
jgi:hypothetical protein